VMPMYDGVYRVRAAHMWPHVPGCIRKQTHGECNCVVETHLEHEHEDLRAAIFMVRTDARAVEMERIVTAQTKGETIEEGS
jgi:hypothetical protein